MVLIDAVDAVREGNALRLCCRSRAECAPTCYHLSNWKDDADALARLEQDVHGYLASFEDPRRKFTAMNDLCKAFKDEAPDTTRTSLMLAKLEEILTKVR
jgi:hypothetical protein